jgi:hypothetical protein
VRHRSADRFVGSMRLHKFRHSCSTVPVTFLLVPPLGAPAPRNWLASTGKNAPVTMFSTVAPYPIWEGLARDTHEDGKVRRWDHVICELLGKPSLMELW